VTRFVDAFRAKFQRDPDGDAALAYDATMAIVQALDAVGPDRRRIRDFLHALTGAGVTGPLRFERSGDPAGRSFVFRRAHQHHLEVLTLPGGTPAPRGQ
jgi:branched-chain amino acid transport system substrate-binding protein